MLKLLLLLALHTPPHQQSDSANLYSITAQSIQNQQVTMTDYLNKVVMVFTFDASNPDTSFLSTMDSIKRNNPNIGVIAIPVNDFGTPLSADSIQSIVSANTSGGFLLTEVSKGKRGVGQCPLMQWITTPSQSNPFNIDLEESGECFTITLSGKLYGVIRNTDVISMGLLQTIISNPPQ